MKSVNISRTYIVTIANNRTLLNMNANIDFNIKQQMNMMNEY